MLMPVLIPLFASALRRAETTCNGYGMSLLPRRRGKNAHDPYIHASDIVALCVAVLFGAVLVLLNGAKNSGYVMTR